MANGTGTGVKGLSNKGYGVYCASTTTAHPFLAPASGSWAPSTGTHQKGEFYLDSAAILDICKASGTPGAWQKVVTVIPAPAHCRDSAGGDSPSRRTSSTSQPAPSGSRNEKNIPWSTGVDVRRYAGDGTAMRGGQAMQAEEMVEAGDARVAEQSLGATVRSADAHGP